MDQHATKLFDEIKIAQPPALYLPDNEGRFKLFSDTSETSTAAGLYQY